MERNVERGSVETDFTVGNVFSFSRGIESDQHMRLFVCVRGVRGTQHNGLIAVSWHTRTHTHTHWPHLEQTSL